MKHRGWLAGGLVALLIAAAGVYWLRPASLPTGVAVPGGDGGGLPRATPASENFDAQALERALDVARTFGAQAFLVTRHGHLVAGYYARGFDANTVADAGGFATTLTALAGALALQDGLIEASTFRPFEAPKMVAAISASKAGDFAAYLGNNLWKPTNAAAALLATTAAAAAPSGDCCVYARISDWLRIGILLLDDGRFEGTAILPRGMAARFIARDGVVVGSQAIWLGSMARASEPFTADDVFYMKGRDRWRLWMLPTLNVAILLAAPEGKAGDGWQESRLPNLVTRAVKANPHGDPHAGVPGVAAGNVMPAN
ncbi:MAG: hypothetical protein QM718_00180 [Steroidobacteraceae bacterium]